MELKLSILGTELAICRLGPDEAWPGWAGPGELVAMVRTIEELSVVCPEKNVPAGVVSDAGWRCLKVAGPLDFSLVGVMHALTAPLARAGVSVFAVSTYDTDYLLVRKTQLDDARRALESAGFSVE